ncbi:MAG: hypothetical protein KKI09_06585 [Spirochaetes bacterium]|nr:hypothetical protein [Spirochaetota bacterium]
MGKSAGTLSKELYGEKLAAQVTKKLKSSYQVCYSHKEYCGIGLAYNNGTYYISRVYDGMPDTRTPTIYQTSSEQEFVRFLSEQSDYSMSGTMSGSILFEAKEFFKNNQRITREMLEKFVAGNR